MVLISMVMERRTESRTGDSDGNEDYAMQARNGEIKKNKADTREQSDAM